MCPGRCKCWRYRNGRPETPSFTVGFAVAIGAPTHMAGDFAGFETIWFFLGPWFSAITLFWSYGLRAGHVIKQQTLSTLVKSANIWCRFVFGKLYLDEVVGFCGLPRESANQGCLTRHIFACTQLHLVSDQVKRPINISVEAGIVADTEGLYGWPTIDRCTHFL